MAAKYDLYENPNPEKSEEQQSLHARFVPRGRTTTEKLCERAANGNPYKAAEIQAMLKSLSDTIVQEFEAGNVVELGEIGTLSITLDSRPVMEKDEIRSASVRVKNMTLRTSAEMKRKLLGVHLERNPHAWQTKKLDEATIEERLTKFFSANMMMRSKDYFNLRECKPSKGLEELNALIAEGRLMRNVKKGSSVYFPAPGSFGR